MHSLRRLRPSRDWQQTCFPFREAPHQVLGDFVAHIFMNIRYSLLLALLLCPTIYPLTAKADRNALHFSSKTAGPSFDQLRGSTERFRREKRKDTVPFSIPTRLGIAQFDLIPYEIRATNYRSVVQQDDSASDDSLEIEFFTTAVTSDGNKDFARFTVIRDPQKRRPRLRGVAHIDGAYYSVDTNSQNEAEVEVESASKEELLALAASCGFSNAAAQLVGDQLSTAQIESQNLTASAGLPVAEVATEADWEYVQAFGGGAAANAEILAILNGVDAIYQSEIGVTLSVVFQHAWETSADPYTTSDPEVLLPEFANHWSTTSISPVPYDVAHLWTGKNLSGSTVGIAYLRAVCRNIRYGLSERLGSRALSVPLAAHEMGHNFGADHDSCSSSDSWLMCPSLISNSNTFSPTSKTAISSYLSGVTCLTTGSGTPPAAPTGLRIVP